MSDVGQYGGSEAPKCDVEVSTSRNVRCCNRPAFFEN